MTSRLAEQQGRPLREMAALPRPLERTGRAQHPPFSPTFNECRKYFEDRLKRTLPARDALNVLCPFHPDKKASLSINLRKGAWKCHACNIGGGLIHFERELDTRKDNAACWDAIYATIGRDAPKPIEENRGKIVEGYDYRGANGDVVYQAVRYEPKGFSQRRPDGKGGWAWNMEGVTRVPFNLPALITANVALIVEGEKDALNLQKVAAGFPDMEQKLRYAATCNVGGAGKWRDEYSPYFAGKRVLVFPDNDKAGNEHAEQVCTSVAPFAQAVQLVELPGQPDKGDVSDYLVNHTPTELFEQMRAAPKWTPPEQPLAGEKKNNGGFKLFGIGELLSRPEVPPDYSVDGLLTRGTVSCVVSKPKVGKSTFARGLCLAVSRGEPFLGRATRQGACMYFALEERHEEITADFRAMGAKSSDPIEVHADAAPVSAIPALVNLVRQQRPALVVIDPLFRLAHIRDEKAYAEVYAALGPLIDLARETGTHILLTHHSGKSQKVDPIDSPLGSTAIGGAAATTIVLSRRESCRTIQTVTRIGPVLPETLLSFDPDTRRLSVGGTKADADSLEIEGAIIECLETGGEQTEPEVEKHVTGTTAFKRMALRSLVRKRGIIRTGTGKKGDPFKYSFACTEPKERTSVQEIEIDPQTPVNIDEKVVR